ncbi:MAG: hypothetical protein IPK34_12820 [Ramlibacter sp.]|nr:hypothetical protein [Ramlibacter sp.]
MVNATVTAATGNITNTAVGTSTTPDPTPTNTVTVPTPVANVADVTVTKVASAVNATAGQTIGYTGDGGQPWAERGQNDRRQTCLARD